jgi:hypothetical protein
VSSGMMKRSDGLIAYHRGGRVWQAMAIGANCTASPRPFAEVSVTLDNIFVFFP